ncbi:MAG TPA: HAMP domain-containing sensor histidine kinase [Aquella sp.]|nr:HAMP domain-containing sensor histidine kinase [Aquella sp.]
MGKYFEIPFQQIQNNINTLALGHNNKIVDYHFKIDEFNFLQQHLVRTLQLKEDHDAIKQQFGELAASVVHDIASPLMVMDMAIDNISTNPESIYIEKLQKSIEGIRYISKNLLKKYREITDKNVAAKLDINNKCFVFLPLVLKDLVTQKELEYRTSLGSISLEIDNLQSILMLAWLHTDVYNLKRHISNLLNNAYEALQNSQGRIIVRLTYIDTNLLLSIQDTGIGIPADKLEFIEQGYSLKHAGKGIGLTNARQYFVEIMGTFNIDSKYGSGTKITITIPTINMPAWLKFTIDTKKHKKIIVLENDNRKIYNRLQKIPNNLVAIKSFCQIADFQKWNIPNKTQDLIIYLIDDQIADELQTMVQIIDTYNIATNSYLITNNYDDYELQIKVQQLGCKLIPKQLLDYLLVI